MTTALVLILTAALLATLRIAHRLLRQRDAERVRGDLLKARGDLCDKRIASLLRREQMLLDDLDLACETAVALRERVEQLEAEALPTAPNWGKAPAQWKGEVCSTCGEPFNSPPCSLNRDIGWSGHTRSGGVAAKGGVS